MESPFKSPELGTAFGSLNVRHLKTRERGPRYLDGVSQKEQLEGAPATKRPSFSLLCSSEGCHISKHAPKFGIFHSEFNESPKQGGHEKG